MNNRPPMAKIEELSKAKRRMKPKRVKQNVKKSFETKM